MPANVQSLEAIDTVRRALVSFMEQVRDALSELDGEMRRVAQWLEQDRPRYWKHQVRVAADQVHEAQQALHRCLMFPIGGERPSCYEERAALKQAQARLIYCERKVERVRHWQRVLEHELFEYQGRMSQLVHVVEIDVPQAIGTLAKITRRLEDYLAIQADHRPTAYDETTAVQELWPSEAASSARIEGEDSATTDGASAAGQKSENPVDA